MPRATQVQATPSSQTEEVEIRTLDNIDHELTPKQKEAIRVAFAMGFYESPRRCTLDDLSQHFGISKAAVHNRLQVAEQKIVKRHLAGDTLARIAELREQLRQFYATLGQSFDPSSVLDEDLRTKLTDEYELLLQVQPSDETNAQ